MHLARKHREVAEFMPERSCDRPDLQPVAAGIQSDVHAMLLRLLDHLKAQQITALFTNFSHGMGEMGVTDAASRHSWTAGCFCSTVAGQTRKSIAALTDLLIGWGWNAARPNRVDTGGRPSWTCVLMVSEHPAAAGHARFVLQLYVTGATARSTRAIANLRRFCEQHLSDRYELEVIDLYQRPELAAGEQLIAAPTLIKRLPLPLRRLVGDLSDQQRVMAGLDLHVQPT